ncbi:hypothetical protein HYT52_03735 [Candidatus Woesearchaeota archaeon]|nr:hypothetical protein [Candidatus Woesearchaeota archaeon]
MVHLIFIRGASAVGKTTITKEVLLRLKKEYHLDCAYICEDDFRKQMQFKYKAKDLKAHQNSVELIKTIVLKLLQLDHYDLIFIEGQFRYKSILRKYEQFITDNGFSSVIFQLDLDLNEMKERDLTLRNTKSKDIEEVKKDIDFLVPKTAIIIKTKKPVAESVQEILNKLMIKKIVKN